MFFKYVTVFSELRTPLPCHSAGKAALTGVAGGGGSLAQPPPQTVPELQLQLGVVDGKAAAVSGSEKPRGFIPVKSMSDKTKAAW